MYQQPIKIKVHQEIDHQMNHGIDQYYLEGGGDLTVLRTYSKIRYRDQEGYPIEIKWQLDMNNSFYIIEIIQPSYTLRFNPEVETLTTYHTPQGVWELNVQTLELEIEEEDGLKQIKIRYQMTMNDQPLGIYQYHLTVL